MSFGCGGGEVGCAGLHLLLGYCSTYAVVRSQTLLVSFHGALGRCTIRVRAAPLMTCAGAPSLSAVAYTRLTLRAERVARARRQSDRHNESIRAPQIGCHAARRRPTARQRRRAGTRHGELLGPVRAQHTTNVAKHSPASMKEVAMGHNAVPSAALRTDSSKRPTLWAFTAARPQAS